MQIKAVIRRYRARRPRRPDRSNNGSHDILLDMALARTAVPVPRDAALLEAVGKRLAVSHRRRRRLLRWLNDST